MSQSDNRQNKAKGESEVDKLAKEIGADKESEAADEAASRCESDKNFET